MKKLFFLFLVTIFTSSCSKDEKTTNNDIADYTCNTSDKWAQIQPIIQNNCASEGCHSASNSSRVNLTTYAGVKGIIENGLMQNKVFSSTANMPPNGWRDTNEKAKLKCWIDNNYPE